MSTAATLGIVLDGVIALLLVATIGYAVVLNRKLAALRDARAEMQALIGRLSESTGQAERALGALKEHAQDAGGRLQGAVESARGLADDLAFLVERGGVLAGRLDAALGAARSAEPARATPTRGDAPRSGPPTASGPAAAGPRAARETGLLRALQGLR